MLATGDPTPLIEPVRLLHAETAPDGALHISSQVSMDPGNPIFAGHYPGLALVPGVCLIECVYRTVLAAARPRGVSLAMDAVPSARFLSPVFPGETVTAEVIAVPGADRWTAKAALHGPRGAVARIAVRCRTTGAAS